MARAELTTGLSLAQVWPALGVVLIPLVMAALTLPAGWEVAAVVIVVQSLVELFGMLLCLRWLPRLFK